MWGRARRGGGGSGGFLQDLFESFSRCLQGFEGNEVLGFVCLNLFWVNGMYRCGHGLRALLGLFRNFQRASRPVRTLGESSGVCGSYIVLGVLGFKSFGWGFKIVGALEFGVLAVTPNPHTRNRKSHVFCFRV